MAAQERFTCVSEEDISKLVANKASKSTQKVVAKAKKTFEDFLESNGAPRDFTDLSKGQLNKNLRLFFASIRKKPTKDAPPELYKKNAYACMKYGLAKHIKDTMGYDISEDDEFSSSIEVYESMLKRLKQSGLGATSHYPPITEEDLEKLYASPHVFNPDTPVGLQSKVWFELMYYFCRRGQENMREMKTNTFAVKTDASGKRFVYQAIDEATKNHSEKDKPDDTNGEASMYELKGNLRCPVASFEKYLAKLHPECDDLWQRPLDSFVEDKPWFCNRAIGKNTLSSFMKTISTRAKLHKTYTNHSIRATHITVLDNAGFEARDIMRTSGHKSESSIRSYSHSLSDSKKRKISSTLAKNMGHTSRNGSDLQDIQNPNPLLQPVNLPLPAPVMPVDDGSFEPMDVSDLELVQNMPGAVDICTNNASSFSFCPTFNNCNVTINLGGNVPK